MKCYPSKVTTLDYINNTYVRGLYSLRNDTYQSTLLIWHKKRNKEGNKVSFKAKKINGGIITLEHNLGLKKVLSK